MLTNRFILTFSRNAVRFDKLNANGENRCAKRLVTQSANLTGISSAQSFLTRLDKPRFASVTAVRPGL
jgi:hypothetical protein